MCTALAEHCQMTTCSSTSSVMQISQWTRCSTASTMLRSLRCPTWDSQGWLSTASKKGVASDTPAMEVTTEEVAKPLPQLVLQ